MEVSGCFKFIYYRRVWSEISRSISKKKITLDLVGKGGEYMNE